MKIIKNILKTNAGKIALSAMQTLGIATGVAVAGVGAYFAMGSSQDVNPNTVFSSSDGAEVVYVTGHTAGGGYAGLEAAPEEGGEIKSGFQAKLSHSLRMMNEETNKPEILEVDQQEQEISSYKMDGSTEGLGVGAGQQGATELGFGDGGDMSAIQAQIAALQAQAQQKATEAQAAAAGAQQAGDAVAAAQAILRQAGQGKWGKASGMASANGNNLGGEGLQPGSYQASGSSAVSGNARPKEGQTIESSLAAASSKPQPLFDGNVDWRATAGASSMNVNSLTAMAKQSADIATKGGHATDVFMSGEGKAGGISFTGGMVTTGRASSSDFMGDGQIGALAGLVSDLQSEAEEYEEARKALRKKVNEFAGKCVAASLASLWGTVTVSFDYVRMKKEINKFKEEWAEKSYKGFGGARYDKFWYWKKAKVLVDTVFWSTPFGIVTVLSAWGIAAMGAWGKNTIDEEELEGPAYKHIPKNWGGD